jgi:hypothetical protein
MTKTVALFLVFTLSVAMCAFLAKPVSAVSEDSWVSKAPMHEARTALGAAAVNGKIYAIGGNNGRAVSATNEEYDPGTDTWTYKTPMPTPRYAFGIAVYQNKIYCIGGENYDSVPSGDDGYPNFNTWHEYTPSAVNEVYDPATDTWQTLSPMPTARFGVEACVVGDRIYIVGGGSNQTEVYDPVTNHWSKKASMPIEILPLYRSWSCASTVAYDKIYVIGAGYVSGKNTAYNEIYDIRSDTWSCCNNGDKCTQTNVYLLRGWIALGVNTSRHKNHHFRSRGRHLDNGCIHAYAQI